MLKRYYIGFSAMLVLSISVGEAQTPTLEEDWVLLYNKEGIEGWRKSTEHSRFHAWRGQGMIDANFFRVVAVYMDSDRSCEWIADCIENRYLVKPDLEHQTTYNITDLPWPIRDRDLVFSEYYDFDVAQRSVEAKMWSDTHPDAPPTDNYVRATVIDSSFRARWIDERHTWVEVELQVDPEGALPPSLVNTFTRSWPFQTFRALRRQIAGAQGYEGLEQQIRSAYPFGD